MIPTLTGFADRHHVTDVIVVADAGMLSAANLLALEQAGFGFIVGLPMPAGSWSKRPGTTPSPTERRGR